MTQAPKVIFKNDKSFPEFLDFDLLRKEGLEHLGQFSGKIWTDHNIHDPGVTMLEMLCYALIDLGYRTQLPIEDILAVEEGSTESDNNFFTPAEILTCNPTTILDYRKMLMDIDGVRNAWLEVCKESEVQIYLNCPTKDQFDPNTHDETGVITSTTMPTGELTCFETDCPITLNGLYRVIIELDNQNPFCEDAPSLSDLQTKVEAEVKKRLHQYRNLGEDFKSISYLCQQKLGVCIEVDIEIGADAELIYSDILWAIRNFLSPDLNYYTLPELLAKGRSIETIFEGRPFREESYGFIDTAELEEIKLRKEIHLSDIYKLASKIKGVKKIKSIAFVDCNGTKVEGLTECGKWIYQLPENHIPTLCFDCSAIDLFQGTSRISIRQNRLNRLLKDRLSQNKKVLYKDRFPHLDKALPKGQHRPELSDYLSIQNEFPLIYGIGEGGLPPSATKKRKAQALQLKGYLLFFDQLLANYLAQLGHIRDLFSMSPDSIRNGSAKTAFSQKLDSVPLVEKLVRFYQGKNTQSNAFDWTEGTVLAFPVLRESIAPQLALLGDFPEMQLNANALQLDEAFKRDVLANTFQRELNQNDFSVELLEDGCGHFFLITLPNDPNVLLGKQRYENETKAREAAESIVFLGTQKNTYRHFNQAAIQEYTFEVVFKNINYLAYLQNLVEDESTYCERRNQFLDHLLARFSESFTDYSLLLYQAENGNEGISKDILENKACFLSNYPTISRNRGKAYNYQLNGWDNNNISGLEKRIATLSGIKEPSINNICNFELSDYGETLRFGWKDETGQFILQSEVIINSADDKGKFILALRDALSNPNAYIKEDLPKLNRYRLGVKFEEGIAWSTAEWSSQERRDKYLTEIVCLYQKELGEDDIFISQYIWEQQLKNHVEKIIICSKDEFSSEELSIKNQANFIKKINQQIDKRPKENQQTLNLITDQVQKDSLLDRSALKNHVTASLPYAKWQWLDETGDLLLTSSQAYADQDLAASAFLDLSEEKKGALIVVEGENLELALNNANGLAIAKGTFPNETAKEKAKISIQNSLASNDTKIKLFPVAKTAYKWVLRDKKELQLFQGLHLYSNKLKTQRDWRNTSQFLSQKNALRVIPTKWGNHSIGLFSPNGQLVGVSPTYTSNNVAELEKKIAELQELLKVKKNIELEKVEQAYSFQLVDTEDSAHVLLSSYRLFPDKVSALAGLKAALQFGKARKYYKDTGDEPNMNYSFFLQDDDKQFIGAHSTYPTDEERKKAKAKVIAFIKNYRIPLSFKEEYAFQLVDENQNLLLESETLFETPQKAKKEFEKAIPVLSDKFSFSKTDNPVSKKYSFDFKHESHPAKSPIFYNSKEKRDSTIQQILNIFQKNRYQIAFSRKPKKWKFQYWGRKNIEGPLLESFTDYDSPDDARDALQLLKDNFGNAFSKETQREGQATFNVFIQNRSSPFATHPNQYTDPEESRNIQLVADRTFQHLAVVNSVEFPIDELIIENTEDEKGRIVYRVAKKNQPLAFHPCLHFKVSTTDELVFEETLKRLCEKAKEGYQFLEICLAGDITCILIDPATGLKVFHYVIRNKKTGEVYFISYQHFGTEAEAIDAFNENYLRIIELASDATNFGEWIAAEPNTNGQIQACEANTTPLVYMPLEIQKNYTKEELAKLFCTYPIRRFEPIEDKKACQPKESTTKYYFHLVDETRDFEEGDCKLDWKSTKCYETITDAYNDFRQFLHLLPFKGNFKGFTDENGQLFCWAKDHWPKPEELAAGCCQICEEKAKDEETPPCEEGLKIRTCCCFISICEVLLESKKRYSTDIELDNTNSQLTTFCKPETNNSEEAWKGLEELLKVACDDEAYYTCYDEQKECFTFWVVGEDFKLAEHPHTYHTAKERNEKLEVVFKNAIDSKKETVKVETTTIGGALSFQIVNADNQAIIWSGLKRYTTVEEAIKAGYITLKYAKEARFYHIDSNSSRLRIANKSNNSSNINDSHFLAEHPQQNVAPEPLILLAKKHPIICTEAGYGFEIYWENFETTIFDDSNPIDLKGQNSPIKEVKGGLIWKGRKYYETEKEAEEYFEQFCEAIKEREWIKPVEKADCAGFTFELVDPEKLLACHPQCYPLICEVEEAIERTKACVNKEAFHLVEHILLRPRKKVDGEECAWLLPALPDCDCELCFEPAEKDFCIGESIINIPDAAGTANRSVSIAITDASCKKANGRARVLLEEGKKESDFHFNWTPNVSSSQVASNLKPGNYSVEITSIENEERTISQTFTIGDIGEKYIPGSDPYSFWNTLILPGWTKQYRNFDFRKYFSDLIEKEAPAHQAFRICWVTPKQLCKFETVFKKWRKWLANQPICEHGNMPCEFINCLFNLEEMAPDIAEPTNGPCVDSKNNPRVNKTALFNKYFFDKNRVERFQEIDITHWISNPRPYINLPINILTGIYRPINFNFPLIDPLLDLRSNIGVENISEENRVENISPIEAESITEVRPENSNNKEAESITEIVPIEKSSNKEVENTSEASEPSPKKKASSAKRKPKTSPKPKGRKTADKKIDWRPPRRKNYLQNIEAIATKQLSATKSYQHAHSFLKKLKPSIKDYEKVVQFIIKNALSRAGGNSDEHYFTLIYNATAYMLDNLVYTDKNKVQEEEILLGIFSKLKTKKADPEKIRNIWQAKALKKETKAKVITAYLKLLKNIDS